MTRFSSIAFVLALFICFGQVAAQKSNATPRFSDYPETNIFTGKNASVKLASSEDRRYRTRLKEAARENADFAGHYKIALIGCGTSCMIAAAIDLRTGKVSWFPETIFHGLSDEAYDIINEGAADYVVARYSVDSKLLITSTLNEQDSDKYVHLDYYVFENNRFRLIKSVKKRRSDI